MPLAAIFGLAGPELTARERAFFRAHDPFGFILFARNVETPAQMARLTADLRETLGRDAPVLIDQEGGRVQRMGPPHWRAWPPPLEERGLRALELRYRIIAAELRAVGVDVNCAPCLDVATAATHPFLRNRCLGRTGVAVAEAGRVVAAALLAGGVLPVIKHMPGHGAGAADSHGGPVIVSKSRADLAAEDFLPFAALKDLPLGMTGHMIVESLAPEPVTVSRAAISVIRGEIGFGGLLMSDDLSMGALDGAMASRTSQAISAGCDVVLHCNGDMAEMEAVAGAAPALQGRAEAAADAALARRQPPDMVDLKELIAEYTAIA